LQPQYSVSLTLSPTVPCSKYSSPLSFARECCAQQSPSPKGSSATTRPHTVCTYSDEQGSFANTHRLPDRPRRTCSEEQGNPLTCPRVNYQTASAFLLQRAREFRTRARWLPDHTRCTCSEEQGSCSHKTHYQTTLSVCLLRGVREFALAMPLPDHTRCTYSEE